MKYRIYAKEDTYNIVITGHIKFNDHNIFKNLINEEITNCKLPVICFDFENLEFIDSSGISMLIMAKEHINNNSQKLEIKNINGQVKRLFEMTNMHEYLFETNNN